MNSKINRLFLSLLLSLVLILGLLELIACSSSRPEDGYTPGTFAPTSAPTPTQGLGPTAVSDDDVPKTATNTPTTIPPPSLDVRAQIPGLSPCDTYAVYYGPLNEEALTDLEVFDLVIVHPDIGITRTQIARLQAAGVMVLVYVSIGEEPSGVPKVGDGLGPVYYDSETSCADIPNRRCENKGVASYYLDEKINNDPDEAGHDGLPDVMSAWGGFYVDPASSSWADVVRFCRTTMTDCNFYGADYAINTLGADGLFLDTIDTASPWHTYAYTLADMANFISKISSWYSNDKYVVLNRGLFFADPKYSLHDVVRPSINGVVFENYSTEWDWEKDESRNSPWAEDNRDYWAPILISQATMTDGFTVFALDYFTPTQQISITHQISETIEGWGWLDYISTPMLSQVRWETWAYCNR